VALKKILYVILDGLGDDPNPALGGATPLEAARTPNLDRLAAAGRNGYVTTVGEGIAPESDIAVFAVLGYDPRDHHSGRGPLESVGVGLDVADGDLAYRVNFATVERDGDRWRIVDRRVGRNLTSAEAAELATEVNEKVALPGVSFDFRATIGHRGVLVLRSEKGPLSAEVENSDPAYGRVGSLGVALETFEPYVVRVAPLDGHEDDERARRAATITNEWLAAAFEVLDASGVNERRRSNGRLAGNFVLTRDGGDHVPKLQSFKDRFGPAMGCFVEMPVELGIARLMGMGVVEAPSGVPQREQYEAWAALTLEAIRDYDGLYVHRIYFGGVLDDLDLSKVIVAVTADHSTSCLRKAHTDGPVPLLISGGSVPSDGVDVYGETAARHGSLGHLLGPEIMPNLVEAAHG